MSVKLPNGSVIYLASGLAAALTVTALTNANPAVATSAAHGLSNGDFVRVTSGWSRLNQKVVRVANVTANTLELEGIDTSDTDIYPAGSGIGSVEEVSGWTQLQQILTSGSNGGEQQFLEYQFLEADQQTRIPTVKSAAGLTFSVADDPSLAGYVRAEDINDSREAVPMRIRLANGSMILYDGYVSVNKTPSLNVNELMAVEVTYSMTNEPVRYAS
jgi:hypothetical protein